MKKYKCIQKYPHGPILGKEIHDSWENESRSLANFPDFWEEIINPNYQVISYCNINDNSVILYNFKSDICNEIYSVKRLSDGTVFSLKDTFYFQNNTFNKYTIDEIFLGGSQEIRISSNNRRAHCTLDCAQKIHPIIFTTEDGKELTEKDEFWVVNDNFKLVGNRAHTYPSFTKKKTEYLLFADKEKAENFIVENRPCLSVKDIIITINLGLGVGGKLRKLVRSKIL